MSKDPLFNIIFVEAVKKHECLWNFSLKEYNFRESTNEAWEQISKEFGEPVDACRDRWRNIRNAFIRSLKLPSDGRSARKKKKDYYLSSQMQFILPFIKTERITMGLPEDEIADTNLGSSTLKSYEQDPLGEASSSPKAIRDRYEISLVDLSQEDEENCAIKEDTEDSLIEISPSPTAVSDEASPSRKRPKYNNRNDTGFIDLSQEDENACMDKDCDADSLSATIPSPKSISGNASPASDNQGWVREEISLTTLLQGNLNRNTVDKAEDPNLWFLKSLLPDIRQMTHKQNRQFRQRVIGLIDDILWNVDIPSESTTSGSENCKPTQVIETKVEKFDE